MHALVTCRLDYCNVLNVGLLLKSLWIPQLMQNATDRILTDLGHRNHITSEIQSWTFYPDPLCVSRLVLKLLVLKSNSLGPVYLKDVISICTSLITPVILQGHALNAPTFWDEVAGNPRKLFPFMASKLRKSLPGDMSIFCCSLSPMSKDFSVSFGIPSVTAHSCSICSYFLKIICMGVFYLWF